MTSFEHLTFEIKKIILEVSDLAHFKLEDIQEDTPLFDGGLNLDSIDILELAVILDKKYKLKIKNDEAGKKILTNVGSIADAVYQLRSEPRALF